MHACSPKERGRDITDTIPGVTRHPDKMVRREARGRGFFCDSHGAAIHLELSLLLGIVQTKSFITSWSPLASRAVLFF